MPSLPKGPVAVRGHGLAPGVIMRWGRIDRAITEDMKSLRADMARSTLAGGVYPEHLLHGFKTTAIEEGLLHAQFEHVMLRTMDAQERKLNFAIWSPILNTALKVSATLKGPRYHKLLILKEILRLTHPGLIPEKEVSLHEYLAVSQDRSAGEAARETRGREKRTAPPDASAEQAKPAPPPT